MPGEIGVDAVGSNAGVLDVGGGDLEKFLPAVADAGGAGRQGGKSGSAGGVGFAEKADDDASGRYSGDGDVEESFGGDGGGREAEGGGGESGREGGKREGGD